MSDEMEVLAVITGGDYAIGDVGRATFLTLDLVIRSKSDAGIKRGEYLNECPQ